MSGTKMTFAEIKADKDAFLKNYGLEVAFKKCACSWDDLIKIGESYEKKRNGEYLKIVQTFISEVSQFTNVHSYRYRIKGVDSLLAKIIKKNKVVTVDNYFNKITDLWGIRILYILGEAIKKFLLGN